MKTIRAIPLWVYVVCMALTLLIEAPWIALPFYAGTSYRGIDIVQMGNDEHYYLSRARAVLEGNPLGQPFIAGATNVPDAYFSDVEYVYMSPLRALGQTGSRTDVPMLYNALNTIGVFLLLLLIYGLVYALSEDAFISATAAIFAIGGYFWIENGTIFYMLLKHHPIFQSVNNTFGRSSDPYTALIPFFGFLICTYIALTREFPCVRPSDERGSAEASRPNVRPSFQNLSSFKYIAGAGLLFAVLFYDYFYAWTFATAFIGSVVLTSLAWKRWHSAITAAIIGCIGVVLGAPQVLGLYRLYSSAAGQQIIYFMQSAHSHAPIASATGSATIVLFALYWYLRRDDKNNFFIFALILTGWVALEQQIITGRVVEYGHYYWYFVVPLSIVVAVYMSARLIGMYSAAYARWFCIALIAAAFINTAGGQYKAFFANLPSNMREQDFAPIMKKLQDLPKGVILGDPYGSTTYMLPTIYTGDQAYFNYAGVPNVFPLERLHDALLTYLYLNKDSRSDPVAYFKKELASATTSSNYTSLYEDLEGLSNGIPSALYRKVPPPHTNPQILAARATFLPTVGKDYRAFASSPQHVKKVLTDAGVKYILWDQRQYPEWDPSVFGPLVVLATSTDITLFGFSAAQ